MSLSSLCGGTRAISYMVPQETPTICRASQVVLLAAAGSVFGFCGDLAARFSPAPSEFRPAFAACSTTWCVPNDETYRERSRENVRRGTSMISCLRSWPARGESTQIGRAYRPEQTQDLCGRIGRSNAISHSQGNARFYRAYI